MSAPNYADGSVTVHHGDCLDLMRTLPDCSVDSIVTDPPYGLGFMGRAWDALPPGREWAEECLRVLKPGGHLLAFGGTRTWHRLACAVEDAGFEIRDSIAWLYGSGFPKSLNVAKAISTGGRPEDIRRAAMGEGYAPSGRGRVNYDHGAASAMNGIRAEVPLTDEAEQWRGWGTALKPAFEPVVVGRKPLAGTVAQNVLTHGTGALNIDGCRVVASDAAAYAAKGASVVGLGSNRNGDAYGDWSGTRTDSTHAAGRWPANVVLSDDQAAELDRQSGETASKRSARGSGKGETGTYGAWGMADDDTRGHDDTGGASRFMYVAKADASERPRVDGTAHPTVKPLSLMRWLVRLVTPPGGTVLEPFAGSGTTVEACIIEGFRCIAIEREAEYLPLIEARISRRRDPVRAIELAREDMGLFGLLDDGGSA